MGRKIAAARRFYEIQFHGLINTRNVMENAVAVRAVLAARVKREEYIYV